MMFETNESVTLKGDPQSVTLKGDPQSVALKGDPQQGEPIATTQVAAKPVAPAAMPGTFHIAGSLFVVVAVIFAAAFLLRRMQGLRGAARGAVMLKGGLQVGARERVLLIEAQGRRVLVGVAPGSVRALHVFEAGEVATAPETLPIQPAVFAEKLKALLRTEA